MRKSLLLTLVILLISSIVSVAQCAMCTKTAAGLDGKSATGLNNAIIYNTAPFKFDFVTGNKIRVETVWMASTSSLGTSNTMLGRFYMNRVIY